MFQQVGSEKRKMLSSAELYNKNCTTKEIAHEGKG